MEKLEQGRFHPLLEQPKTDMSPAQIQPGSPRWKKSTIAKSYLNSLLIAVQNICMSLRHGNSQCMYYMNIHELHQGVGQIALASHSTLNIDIRHLQVHVSGKTDHVGVATMERPRSSPSSTIEHPTVYQRQTCRVVK
jgi:hypothetical protein